MFFDRSEYDMLASIVFRPEYPGWKPDVKEIPNGDGKVDEKMYAHIAPKYLPGFGTGRERTLLMRALFRAHEVAEKVADELHVPQAFRPDIRYGALRVLAYPPATGISHRHTDFDLFTVPIYRDQEDKFVRYASHDFRDSGYNQRRDNFDSADEVAPGLHLGELGEAIGLGGATPHEVLPSDEGQLSIVYFAIPDHDAILTFGSPKAGALHRDGTQKTGDWTVKEWLNERMARSRTAFKAYQ